MLRALAVLLLLPGSPPAPAAQAKNLAGLRELQHGRISESVELLRAAVAADSTYAIAHYNLACALARARAAGKVCEVDAYRSTIVEELSLTFALDPPHRARAKGDEDLASVRDTLGWQHLVLQRDLARDNDVRAILVAVSWYGPAPGAFGPMSSARFSASGKVTLTKRELGEDIPKDRAFSGSFTVKDGQIIVTIDGKRALAHLTWDGLVIEGWDRFTDDPDDCSA